jgi:ATP-dependent Clp protease ATP-binding subunit ClpA
MPNFSRSLEQSLHRALVLANERHHKYAMPEHLLRALVDDPDAADVMRACNVDIDKLRRNVAIYVESHLENLVTDGAEDSKPTAGFQRVIQRAMIDVQSSGREEVTGANVLVAIFTERETHAAHFLEQVMTRDAAVNYISEVPGQKSSRSIVLFSAALDGTLYRALADANARKHEYATLEHLLLALVDDQDAAAVMRACNVAIDKLRRNLVTYVESELKDLVTDGSKDSKPTAGFERVIQRARQSSGREEVTGANVLVAILSERESRAACFLQEQEMTRYDAVNYISHGLAKGGGEARVVPAHETGQPTVFFSTALEGTLRRALADGTQRQHEYATLEHLLLALIDDVDASALMNACQVDRDALKADVVHSIDNDLKTLATGDHRVSRPTVGIQRVVQRAVHHVGSLGRGTATGEDLLVAMFDENDSPAVWLLGKHGMTHQEATNFRRS